jgi:hypothetical protein
MLPARYDMTAPKINRLGTSTRQDSEATPGGRRINGLERVTASGEAAGVMAN